MNEGFFPKVETLTKKEEIKSIEETPVSPSEMPLFDRVLNFLNENNKDLGNYATIPADRIREKIEEYGLSGVEEEIQKQIFRSNTFSDMEKIKDELARIILKEYEEGKALKTSNNKEVIL